MTNDDVYYSIESLNTAIEEYHGAVMYPQLVLHGKAVKALTFRSLSTKFDIPKSITCRYYAEYIETGVAISSFAEYWEVDF